jgi:glycosyltransferase involved in cell wall biosynthesis
VAKKDSVWIFQTHEIVAADGKNSRKMRIQNLSSALICSDFEVTVWTTNFNHHTKKHRFKSGRTEELTREGIRYLFINSPGYKRNKSIKRIIDHIYLAVQLRRELVSRTPPAFAIVGYPPIEFAWVSTRWLRRNNVPFCLDIKDAWPDIFTRAFPKMFRPLAWLLIIPYKFVSSKVFKSAPMLMSITQPFLDWTLERAGRKQNSFDLVLPLTSIDVEFGVDEINEAWLWLISQGVSTANRPRAYFVGSINSNYDFNPVFELAKQRQIEIVIGGDGEYLDFWKDKANGIDNVIWLGRVNETVYSVLASFSDLALAPLKDLPDFAMSIPNKFYDAMRYGTPILSSITGFCSEFINENEIGITYSSDKSNDIIEKYDFLINNCKLKTLSNNATELYKEKFDGDLHFKFFCQRVQSMINLE